MSHSKLEGATEASALSSSSSSVLAAAPDEQAPRTRYRDRVRRQRFWLRAVLLSVVVASGLLVGVVRPNVLTGRLNANESAAIATLKSLSSAQSQLQASGALDVNGNGQGEYGFFAELAGAVPLRGSGQLLDPPVLSPTFGNVVGGRIQRGGYWFQIHLPSVADGWAAERPAGGGGPEVSATHSEVAWMCYAWPVERGVTGNRAFFINQSGDVVATNMTGEAYGGTWSPLPGLSAFAVDEQGLALAANTMDSRGNVWVVV